MGPDQMLYTIAVNDEPSLILLLYLMNYSLPRNASVAQTGLQGLSGFFSEGPNS